MCAHWPPVRGGGGGGGGSDGPVGAHWRMGQVREQAAREAADTVAAMIQDVDEKAAAVGQGLVWDDEPVAPAWARAGPNQAAVAVQEGQGPFPKARGGMASQRTTAGDEVRGPRAERAAGLYPHAGWRPRAGYQPVDTSGVDALRPADQREAAAVLDRRERARAARAARRQVRSARSDGRGGDEKKRFSFSEHVRYQAAIKAVLRASKRRRAAAT